MPDEGEREETKARWMMEITVKVPFVEPATITVPINEMCNLDCSDHTT